MAGGKERWEAEPQGGKYNKGEQRARKRRARRKSKV